ncbi:hypothetical protein OTU49_003546 [Cherax quadricarinatus]|uniref:Uncharacterized protein n=1 Tax=Cherax quadricarinatus TaxID=27406 RepID=A0AAW0XIX1_CHEQU
MSEAGAGITPEGNDTAMSKAVADKTARDESSLSTSQQISSRFKFENLANSSNAEDADIDSSSSSWETCSDTSGELSSSPLYSSISSSDSSSYCEESSVSKGFPCYEKTNAINLNLYKTDTSTCSSKTSTLSVDDKNAFDAEEIYNAVSYVQDFKKSLHNKVYADIVHNNDKTSCPENYKPKVMYEDEPFFLNMEIQSLELTINNMELQLPMLKSLLKKLKQARQSGLLHKLLAEQEYPDPLLNQEPKYYEKPKVYESFPNKSSQKTDAVPSVVFDDLLRDVGFSDEFKMLQPFENIEPTEHSVKLSSVIQDDWEFEFPHLCVTPTGEQCSALCQEKIDPSQYTKEGNKNDGLVDISENERTEGTSTDNFIPLVTSSVKVDPQILPVHTPTEFHECNEISSVDEERLESVAVSPECYFTKEFLGFLDPQLPASPTSQTDDQHSLKGVHSASSYIEKESSQTTSNIESPGCRAQDSSKSGIIPRYNLRSAEKKRNASRDSNCHELL